jgi:hypothetical protein
MNGVIITVFNEFIEEQLGWFAITNCVPELPWLMCQLN